MPNDDLVVIAAMARKGGSGETTLSRALISAAVAAGRVRHRSRTDGASMAPASGIAMCHVGCSEHHQQRDPSMGEISTIGIDLAKSVFQLHSVDAEGRVALRRQLRRSQMLEFFQRLPPCLIGMEACASAHYRAREFGPGHRDLRSV